MQKVKVEKWGGIEVSRLGYGCMRFPMKDGKIDGALSGEMLDTAYKNGVNYFDSAYVYLGGQSEGFVGATLSKYPRDSYYMATKLPVWEVERESDVNKLFEEQLIRLGMDYIDFYMLHALNAERWAAVKELKMIERLADLKERGKIKFLGFSYHGDYDTFADAVGAYPWDFVQIQINYSDYDLIGAGALYRLLGEKGIPCIVMEPVRGGFLAEPPMEVRDIMAKADPAVSPAAWALRWCMDLENAPVILSGMNELSQVEENIGVFERGRSLSPEEREMFGRCVDILKAVKSIPCTSCGYCMDCPYGVDIPGIYGIYNIYRLFGSTFRANADYKDFLNRGVGFEGCVKCGACTPKCPQGIEIPEKLEEMHEFLLTVHPPR